MNGVNLLDGFQLDNDTALNQYIEFEVGAHAMSSVHKASQLRCDFQHELRRRNLLTF